MGFRKVKELRWWMIGLIMLGAILNYLTRSALAVAAPTNGSAPPLVVWAILTHNWQFAFVAGGLRLVRVSGKTVRSGSTLMRPKP